MKLLGGTERNLCPVPCWQVKLETWQLSESRCGLAAGSARTPVLASQDSLQFDSVVLRSASTWNGAERDAAGRRFCIRKVVQNLVPN